MTKSVKEIFCPGCHRANRTTDFRRYCATCREDLEKQACIRCDNPIRTDIPYVLCDECEADWQARASLDTDQ